MHPVQRSLRLVLPLGVGLLSASLRSQTVSTPAAQGAWMDATLSPDARAELVMKEMTLEEKLALLHGTSGVPLGPLGTGANAVQSNGGAGMFPGVPSLGLRPIQMADASYGVTHGKRNGRYATAMPSNLAATASRDPVLAFEYGSLVGRELRAHGYNMSLGGGVNLTREPRNGRTFEYQGEDALLAGTMVGHMIRGVQAQHVQGEIKHFALNDQESGRNAADVTIDERAMRETDLRAFEIGIRLGQPNAVMCSYNRVAGDYACENNHLLNDILKGDWKFKSFVLSDWGGTHSTVKAFRAGLDNEEPNSAFLGEPLRKALDAGEVKQAEIDEHAHRILRSEFASGIVDHPIEREVVNVDAGLAASQNAAEQSIVLLKNERRVLPLNPATVHTLAVIGGHADVAMISGGGSAQVDPPGGNVISQVVNPNVPRAMFDTQVWFPEAPLKALQARFPGIRIVFDDVQDPARAAAVAKAADVAIVFGWQWEAENMDLETLALGGNQNALIAAVTTANPRTVVVIESGGPVTMPWAQQAAGIVKAWYSGSRGATALSRILAGDVNPSAKLPLTFPLSDADLPHPTLVKPTPGTQSGPPSGDPVAMAARRRQPLVPFPVHYNEGLKVGYAWYDAEKKPVLFPFGFGLSYTEFAYSALKITHTADAAQASFTITNKGRREGVEIAQVYVALPQSAGEPPKRLVAWKKVKLAAGASELVTLPIEAGSISIFDASAKSWKLTQGDYTILVGGSSQDLPLHGTIALQPAAN